MSLPFKKSVFFIACPIATMVLATSAHAQDVPKDQVTIALNGQLSAEQKSDADTIRSGSVGVQWQHRNISVGATIGTSGTSVRLPSVVDQVGTSSIDASVNAGVTLGRSYLGVNFAYSRQDLNGNATLGSNLSTVKAGSSVDLSGDIVSTSIGGSYSRTFGKGALTATPMLTVSYDRTKTSSGLSSKLLTTPVQFDKTSEGVSITPSLAVTRVISNSFSLTASAAFTEATNGAASRLGQRFSGSSAVQTGQQGEGATQWGTLGLAATINVFSKFTIQPSVGTTVGRSTDEVFGGLTLAVTL